MARKTLGKKDIIRKRLEIANGNNIKRKVQNVTSRGGRGEKRAGTIKPIDVNQVSLSKSQAKKINVQIQSALNKTSKNKTAVIIGGGSRFDRSEIRSGLARKKSIIPPNYKQFTEYEKKQVVDFDVAICISSFNRYDKVSKLVKQFFEQETRYTFKVFFMNDGSTQKKWQYTELKNKYPELIYLKNEKNGGKVDYWKTITNLWSSVKKYETHALCQIDDDFVLCYNFLDTIMDKFFEKKYEDNGYVAFQYHIYEFRTGNSKYRNKSNPINLQSLDGGVLYDIRFMEHIDYSIGQTYLDSNLDSSRVWTIVSDKLRLYGGKVYRFDKSLARHDGNEDSKLNPKIRKVMKMVTLNFNE
jgi:hypothetical protein